MPKIPLGALLPPLIILFALSLRFSSIETLLQKKENVLSCYDCFGYALLTEQRVKGEITGINYLVDVPDYAVNGEANSLITYLGSFLDNFLDLNTVYVVVPPVLATFFVLPLFFWVREFAGLYTFLGASILGVFNLIYWIRTSPGRYDTDFLILSFLFLVLWLVTKLTEEVDEKGAFIYSVLAGLSLNVFMWWYPKPIFVFLFSVSLLFGCIAFRNSLKLIALKFVLFLLAGGVANLTAGARQLWGYIESRVFYEPSAFVPVSMSKTVVELQPLSFESLVKHTSDNPVFTLLSLLGLVLLFLKRWRYMLVASPFVLMGFSAFVAGNRMLMYLAPFLGLGAGFLVEGIYKLLAIRVRRFKPLVALTMLFLLFLISFPPYVLAFERKQLFSDEFYSELKKLITLTEPEAYIWTWWDFGNVIQYAGRRGTYIDNGNWNIVKSHAVAYSFMSQNQSEARNLIAYVSNNRGLRTKYKGKTYNDFLNDAVNYKEETKNAVYIFISPDLLSKPAIRWVGSYGTDFKPEFLPVGSPIHYCEVVNEVIDCSVALIDELKMSVLSSKLGIKGFYVYDRDKRTMIKSKIISNKTPLNLFLIQEANRYYAVMLEDGMEKTNLVQWFLFKNHSQEFELVYDNFPVLTLYKVK